MTSLRRLKAFGAPRNSIPDIFPNKIWVSMLHAHNLPVFYFQAMLLEGGLARNPLAIARPHQPEMGKKMFKKILKKR